MDELLTPQAPSGGAATSGTVQSDASSSIAASSWGGLQLNANQLGVLGLSSQAGESRPLDGPPKTGDAVFQTDRAKPTGIYEPPKEGDLVFQAEEATPNDGPPTTGDLVFQTEVARPVDTPPATGEAVFQTQVAGPVDAPPKTGDEVFQTEVPMPVDTPPKMGSAVFQAERAKPALDFGTPPKERGLVQPPPVGDFQPQLQDDGVPETKTNELG
jgi:hypothetical protein